MAVARTSGRVGMRHAKLRIVDGFMILTPVLRGLEKMED
jgi:hypothetical protein